MGEQAAETKCMVTSNPCGTDTWGAGHECECFNCQKWLEAVSGLSRAERRIAALRTALSRNGEHQ